MLDDHWLVYNNRRADVGPPVQHAGRLGERRQGDRLLRAGLVVDEPPDAERRRPLGQVRRHDAGPVDAGRHASPARASFPGKEAHQPQHRGVWRLGAVVRPDRQRPHGAQGQLQPLRPAGRHRSRDQRQPVLGRHADCPWTDPNGNRKFDVGEINLAPCPAFSGGTIDELRRRRRWPYSDEITAGVETQLPGAVRVGAMFYYRTNRDQIGQATRCSRRQRLHRAHRDDPERPRRHAAEPEADDRRRSTTSAAAANALNASVRDNVDYLDTEYKGVEFTATKRFSRKWQMQTGFTLGKNEGGVNARRHGPERSEQHAASRRASSATTPSRRSASRAATSCRGTSPSRAR